MVVDETGRKRGSGMARQGEDRRQRGRCQSVVRRGGRSTMGKVGRSGKENALIIPFRTYGVQVVGTGTADG